MADEPEKHTLRLLREIRDEQVSFRTEVVAAFGEPRTAVAAGNYRAPDCLGESLSENNRNSQTPCSALAAAFLGWRMEAGPRRERRNPATLRAAYRAGTFAAL
jgi:hypothetical protein